MMKRILATTIAAILVVLLLPMTALAEPFAEITIAANAQSAIKAVEFDSVAEYDWKDGDCGGGKSIRPDERVDTEPGAGAAEDFDGNIGWTDHGSWVQWTVNVAADGDYRFEAWCASDNGSNEGLSLLYNDTLIGSIDYVEQEGWQEYTLYKFGDMSMKAGKQIIKAQWGTVGGFNIAAIIVTPLVNGYPMWMPVQLKIAGSGKNVIKAVDFDSGVNGFAFDAGGGDAVRSGEGVNTEANGSEFGANIGWISAGDWVQYTVKVERDGMYKFDAWLASDAGEPGNIEVYVGDKLVGASPNSNKGGWQAYDLLPVGEIALTAGEYVIKTTFPSGNMNFAALEVTRTGNIEVATEAPPADNANNAENNAVDEVNNNEGADVTPTEAATSAPDAEGNNMTIVFIIIGAVVVIAIVVIIVIGATKKKK